MTSPLVSYQVFCPAKINLWLKILGKRPDGYHNIESRLCPIDLHDVLTMESLSGLRSLLTCSDPSIPINHSNLILQAIQLFHATTQTSQHWKIHLEKKIPHGAGLGGGSSNAASVLLKLNEAANHPLSFEKLVELAGKLGADVPFFLFQSACDVTGTGTELRKVSDFPWELPLVLVKPNFGIPTPWAYQRWSLSKPLAGQSYAPQLCDWGKMVNDLERPVFEKWIWIPTMKNWLLSQPETKAALMSGSGSTVFAVCNDGVQAHRLAEKAQQLAGETAWVKVSKTLHYQK